MRIGIYAPYDRTEISELALRLAIEAGELGQTVSWWSLGRRESGLHHEWDDRFAAPPAKSLALWGARQDEVIWFAYRPRLVQQIQRWNPQGRHVWVPSWHTLPEEAFEPDGLPFDTLVLPSHQAADLLAPLWHKYQAVGPPAVSRPLSGVRWAAAWPVQGQRRIVPVDRQRACFVCPPGTMDRLGGAVFYLVDRLLDAREALHVSLLSEKTWPTRLKHRLTWLTHRYPGRFTHVDRPIHAERVAALSCQDCIVDLALRRESGLALSSYLSLGIPVSMFDLPPATELMVGGCRELLLPCDLSLNWCAAPTATIHLRAVLARLQCVLNPDLLTQARVKLLTDETRQEAREEFGRFWRSRWQLDDDSDCEPEP